MCVIIINGVLFSYFLAHDPTFGKDFLDILLILNALFLRCFGRNYNKRFSRAAVGMGIPIGGFLKNVRFSRNALNMGINVITLSFTSEEDKKYVRVLTTLPRLPETDRQHLAYPDSTRSPSDRPARAHYQ